MMEFFRSIMVVMVPLFLQTMYLSYRFGRIDQRLEDHEYRIRRIELMQDQILVQIRK